MSLAGPIPQATDSNGSKLYVATLTYNTRILNKRESHRIHRRNLTQGQLRSTHYDYMDELARWEALGQLDVWIISIQPQLSYKRLESSLLKIEARLKAESALTKSFFPNLPSQLELLK